MKSTQFLLLAFTFSIGTVNAQEYKFLNDIFSNSKNVKIYLKQEFESLNKEKFIDLYFTESFFKNNWEPLPSDKTPDASVFFSNVSLEHLRAMVLSSPKTEEIDFSQLNEYFVKVNDAKQHFKNNESFIVISKPLFSCNNQWALLYKYSVFKKDVANSGMLYIYRKINDKWTLFHKITLWIS